MRILHTVQSYPPSTGGMQEVVSQLSRRLVEKGHEVTVATSAITGRPSHIDGVNIAQFTISGSPLRGYGNPQEIERYHKLLTDKQFDVVTFFAAQQWATDTALPILDQIAAKKVFVPTGFSALPLPRYKRYFESIADTLPQFDMNVFLSDDYRDINFARHHGITKLAVIPNGAATEEFEARSSIDIRAELGIAPSDFLILTVGSHNGQKGHKEAIKIFRRAKIKNAHLIIVGNKVKHGCSTSCSWQAQLFTWQAANKASHKSIILPHFDRTETVAAYIAADLFLFPSLIECSPLVLFESAASKTPFLATDVGNAREIVQWTKGGIILPTRIDRNGLAHAEIGASVQMLENVWRDKQKRQKLAQAGYNAWKKQFTWDIIAEKYNKLYKNLTTGRTS